MPDFARDENGIYQTKGLSPKEFDKVFNIIAKKQRQNRRAVRGLLTPALMNNKSLAGLLGVLRKRDGTDITPSDLKQYIQSKEQHKKTFGHKVAGITYAQLISHSRKIDIDRANNKVTNGLGITNGTFIGMQADTATISVKASDVSRHAHHRVKIRFEDWDDVIERFTDDKTKPDRVVRDLCKGRVSFDCDCGRHQFWYRYMATAGNYAITPPKEYAFPKVRNPELKGVACKHVIHAMTRLQSASWQKAISRQLEKIAKSDAYGDDKKKTTQYFTGDDAKALARNRASQTNQGKAANAWNRYMKAQDVMAKKQKTAQAEIDKVRKQLTRAKTSSQKKTAELAKERAKTKALQDQLDKQKETLKQLAIEKKEAFLNAMGKAGIKGKAANAAYQAWLSTQTEKHK
jgi:hypothetical protein